MASGSVTILTWHRARLLLQHGVGLRRSRWGRLITKCLHLSEWVSDTFSVYRDPRKKHVSTLRVSTSLKTSQWECSSCHELSFGVERILIDTNIVYQSFNGNAVLRTVKLWISSLLLNCFMLWIVITLLYGVSSLRLCSLSVVNKKDTRNMHGSDKFLHGRILFLDRLFIWIGTN